MLFHKLLNFFASFFAETLVFSDNSFIFATAFTKNPLTEAVETETYQLAGDKADSSSPRDELTETNNCRALTRRRGLDAIARRISIKDERNGNKKEDDHPICH